MNTRNKEKLCLTLFLFHCTLPVLTASPTLAQTTTNGPSTAIRIKDPSPYIYRQILLLEWTQNYVLRSDLPRIKGMIQSSQDVLQSIRLKGVSHRDSLQEILRMILLFRYSNSFFNQISSSIVRPKIEETLKIQSEISEIFGFDQVQASNIVELILRQMHALVRQLITIEVPEQLKGSLFKLIPQLGRSTAEASPGDRPNAFSAGDEVYCSFKSLYEQFRAIGISDISYNLVTELITLNEFYAQYSQFYSRSKTQSTSLQGTDPCQK